MRPLSANFGADTKELTDAVDAAARAVPPVWPLASSVAVNPYLGQTHEPLAIVAARLARVAGAPVAMPRSWYWERITDGRITDGDLQEALLASPNQSSLKSVTELCALAQNPVSPPVALPTIADLAAGVSGIDWPALFNERFGAWAASFFDEGQALWSAPRTGSAYSAWRTFATHDLTPEILGLSGFATHVSKAPETAMAATAMAVQRIGLSQLAAETYFHQLLMTMGGWAQYARYLLWQSELRGETDATIADFLAIRLLWDMALLVRYEGEIAAQWQDIVAEHAKPVAPDDNQILEAILQDAVDRAQQRQLAATLALPSIETVAERPTLQVAFCIDVRSEVFRRALESVNSGIRTLGFAGFFGMTASHRRFASDVAEHRLPVLLNAGLNSVAGDANDAASDRDARFKARAKRAWGRFKLAAVSSFAFVEATGAVYAGKLVSDALALGKARPADDPAPHFSPPLSDAAQTDMAATVLNAMSLTDNFAPLVILAGHGANVVNNPHASGLQCGACGGYSGEVNARLLVSVLNNPAVREGLLGRGIHVPADTIFVAGLHDTTMDIVTLYSGDLAPNGHAAKLSEARAWLEAAGAIARAERALRLPRATGDSSFARRSRDWAEVRPEWALANCNAFIAAPRQRTATKNLNGRAFLHDYTWRSDTNFGVLELIMTAPVVVASWISLQYYGSTVAPEVFGGGNKLLHNVVGGIGVVEGNGGLMRAGLPWQSVHDGARYIHEPSRLSVCIEAPREAMTDILTRHPGVRALFDNGWLHLFQLDEEGQMAWRYTGNLQWVSVKQNRIEVTNEMATA